MSKSVNEAFYVNLLKFVLLYRDCLNLYGNQKLAELTVPHDQQPTYTE